MNEVYHDPVRGQLTLKRSLTSATRYVDINKRVLAGGKVVYYAKTRLDLNKKKQTKIGEPFNDARECAIHLAAYLKEHPPVPKDAGQKVPAHAA
jgi:hypothetical protein